MPDEFRRFAPSLSPNRKIPRVRSAEEQSIAQFLVLRNRLFTDGLLPSEDADGLTVVHENVNGALASNKGRLSSWVVEWHNGGVCPP
jgi:hypothetical protein